jgi:hypothetical protein
VGGSIIAAGGNAGAGNAGSGGGGAGAGGTIFIQSGSSFVGTNLISAGGGAVGSGAAGASNRGGGGGGGAGGQGIIRIEGPSSGSTSPAAFTASTYTQGALSPTGTPGYGVLYIGSVNTASADLAEYYVAGDSSLRPGDVVSISNEKLLDNGGTEVTNRGVLRKASQPYDPRLLGIISTNPGLVLGSVDGASGQADSRQVALTGRVPVKIDPDSAPILIGDFLTASSKPGYAMKATQAGYTVGKALESWMPNSGQSTIDVFVNLGYYDPDRALDGTDVADMYNVVPVASPSGSLVYQVADVVGNTMNKVVTASQGMIANLTAGLVNAESVITKQLQVLNTLVARRIETKDLAADVAQIGTIKSASGSAVQVQLDGASTESGRFIVTNNKGEQVASVDSTGRFQTRQAILDDMNARFADFGSLTAVDATFSGTLTANQAQLDSARITALTADAGQFANFGADSATIAGTLRASKLEGSVDADQIAGLEARVSALVSLQTASLVALPATASGTPTATSGSFGDVATATTSATIANLSVTNDLSVAGILSANTLVVNQSLLLGRSLLTANTLDFDTEFVLQSSGLGRLSLMANALVISETGGVEFNRNVTINSNLAVNGDINTTGTITTAKVQPTRNQNLEVNLASNMTPDLLATGAATPGEFVVHGINNQEVAAISASGSARFQKLIIAAANTTLDATASAARSISTATSTNATTGTATLPAGQTQLIIPAGQVKSNSLIYLTPTSSTGNRVIYVVSKVGNDVSASPEFTVAVDAAYTSDIAFNWWIIN